SHLQSLILELLRPVEHVAYALGRALGRRAHLVDALAHLRAAVGRDAVLVRQQQPQDQIEQDTGTVYESQQREAQPHEQRVDVEIGRQATSDASDQAIVATAPNTFGFHHYTSSDWGRQAPVVCSSLPV